MEHSPTIQLMLALGVLIAFAKLSGTVARRFNQPRVFGELLAGVILGPTVIDLLHLPIFTETAFLDETIHVLAELGVLFLMFNIGVDVHVSELVAVGKVAILGGVIGAVAPVLMTIPLVLIFNQGMEGVTEAALFAGVTLAATSVSISAQTLLEVNALQTREGNAFLATTLVDDVLAVLMVSLVVATTASGASGAEAEQASFLVIVLRMAAYIVVSIGLTLTVVPRVMTWIHKKDSSNQLTASFAIVLALLFGWSAEAFGGVAAITGAFIAGVGISRTPGSVKREVAETVGKITYSFLAPIFFVTVGLSANLLDLPTSAIPFAVLLLIAAIISKIGGAGLGGRLGGLTSGEALRVGVCMVSRGEVGLIIVTLGLSSGVLNNVLFSSLFLVVLLTTVITPPLVRITFRRAGHNVDG